MDFTFTEEQRAAGEAARAVFAGVTPDGVSSPSLVAGAVADDFDRTLWTKLADADLLSLLLDPAHGGSGLDTIALCLVLRESAKVLARVPSQAADRYIDLRTMEATWWQAAWRISSGAGGALPAAGDMAVAKIWASEGVQRVVQTAQHLRGGFGADVDYPLHRYHGPSTSNCPSALRQHTRRPSATSWPPTPWAEHHPPTGLSAAHADSEGAHQLPARPDDPTYDLLARRTTCPTYGSGGPASPKGRAAPRIRTGPLPTGDTDRTSTGDYDRAFPGIPRERSPPRPCRPPPGGRCLPTSACRRRRSRRRCPAGRDTWRPAPNARPSGRSHGPCRPAAPPR